jgi:hypothetical protein
MKNLLFLTLGLLFSVSSLIQCCEKNEEEGICYEFDQRQCAGDDWSDVVPINDSKVQRQQKMKAFLLDQGIEVQEVSLVENFHEAVCEACFICPEEDRFFVRFNEDDLSKLEELDLLNFAAVDCEDTF